MSAEFTPAPWWVDEDDRPSMEWNRHICAGYSNRICFMSNSGNDPSGEANANLIAAAPDLYEALDALVREANGFESWQRPYATLEPAMKALAKARGGQPTLQP